MAVTIAATAAALNQHRIQYEQNINQSLRIGMETEAMLTPVLCEHTYSAPSAEVSDIVQAYQSGFTPKMNLDFNAVDNTLQRLKIDIKFTADDIDKFYDSWMVEWVECGKSKLEYTFPHFMYETVVLPKIYENMEMQVAFKGVYAAPTVGTAGVTINSCDGLGKKIADAITAGRLTPIATGAITSSNVVSKLEAFCDGLPLAHRNLSGNILMSKTLARQYYRDYRAQFGYVKGNQDNQNAQLNIDGTNINIVGVSSMEGSSRIIFSPKGNLIFGAFNKQGGGIPPIRWQEFDRDLKGLTEFRRFYGVKFWGNTFVNDQA